MVAGSIAWVPVVRHDGLKERAGMVASCLFHGSEEAVRRLEEVKGRLIFKAFPWAPARLPPKGSLTSPNTVTS